MASGKVVVGYVHPTEVSAFFHESMLNLYLYDFNHARRIVNGGGRVARYSSANISNARNGIVRMFLDETKAEWLWMVDADMHFPPDTVEALLANASADKAPIVGGLAFGIADGELFPTLYELREKDGGGVESVRYNEYPRDAMFQVAATGAACLLIHRSVLEAIRAKNFNATYQWFQETELNGSACGEDVTFCLRAGLLGFPVFVNTGVAIGHHKSMVLTEDMYREQRANRKG